MIWKKFNLCLTVLLSFALTFNLARAFTVRNATCSGSKLLDLRIQGCNEEPCRIRKGEPLPFEVDLSFERPRELADDVYFNVYLPKYAKPPAHGSTLLTATCDKGNLGFSCPVSADVPYTLKSSLFIDPLAECTANCELMGANGTGLKQTKWRWSIASRKQKSWRKQGNGKSSVKGRSYSVCQFSVQMDIVA